MEDREDGMGLNFDGRRGGEGGEAFGSLRSVMLERAHKIRQVSTREAGWGNRCGVWSSVVLR